MNIRELTEALIELQLVQGEHLPVLSEDGQDIHTVEFNDDDQPCVLILFQEEF